MKGEDGRRVGSKKVSNQTLTPHPTPLRVALVHDWMVSPGGGERVLLALHELWPEAPIYTAAYEPAKFPEFKAADVRPTWLNRISLARRKHQLFALPRIWAFKGLDLSEYDLVISSSTAEGKGVKTGPTTLHICYCHTPTRYYWSDYRWYLKHPPFGRLFSPIASVALRLLAPTLRSIDFKAAQEVDYFIANSRYVQGRIKQYYKRDSTVIYPPVSSDQFKLATEPGKYFLVLGRQVAYKRLDLAVDAFNELGLPLVVAGTGEEIERQKPRSKSNIKYLGRIPEADLAKVFQGAIALIWPQEEDFGIVPLEAQASGRPVIAFAKGGALETVVEDTTGTFFSEQTPDSLIDAIRRFQAMNFNPKIIRAHAEEFDLAVFKRRIQEFVDSKMSGVDIGAR